MKLIFTKNQENDTILQLQKGTVAEDFSYTEMIKQLLEKNSFEDTVYNNYTIDEQAKIESMLKKINEAIEDNIQMV